MTLCFSLQESNRRTEVGSEVGKLIEAYKKNYPEVSISVTV